MTQDLITYKNQKFIVILVEYQQKFKDVHSHLQPSKILSPQENGAQNPIFQPHLLIVDIRKFGLSLSSLRP